MYALVSQMFSSWIFRSAQMTSDPTVHCYAKLKAGYVSAYSSVKQEHANIYVRGGNRTYIT